MGNYEDVLVRSVMSLYEVAKTRIEVDSELSQEVEVNVGMHQGCIFSPFLLAVMVDVVTDLASTSVLSKLRYADDLVLMNEIIEGLGNTFRKWKEAFEIADLKVKLGETKMMVSGGTSKDGLSKNEVNPSGVCSLRVKVNSVLCIQCGKWIHGRYDSVNKVLTQYC